MKTAKRKVKLSELVEDFDLYPRQSVDSQNVASIREALEAGQALSPVVVEKSTKRIVDGFHRVRAYRKILEPETSIEAIVIEYEDEAELLAHAIQLNAAHGKRLTTWDKLRCIELSREKGMSWAQLAASLGTSEKSLEKLENDRTGFNRTGEVVPLKRAARHMRGQTLTEKQATAQRKLGGNEARFYMQQIILLTDSDLLPVDPVLAGLAQQVVEQLSSWLAGLQIEEAQ